MEKTLVLLKPDCVQRRLVGTLPRQAPTRLRHIKLEGAGDETARPHEPFLVGCPAAHSVDLTSDDLARAKCLHQLEPVPRGLSLHTTLRADVKMKIR